MKKIFGTDGIRGIANQDLTCELAVDVGRAIVKILTTKNKQQKPEILIGKDTRISCDMLENAIASGICSAGANVHLLGVLPTPAIAFLTKKYKAAASIIVSASHNSFEFNGIKIFKSDGYKLDDHLEEKIEKIIFSKKETKLSENNYLGKVIVKKEGKKDYINHIKSCVNTSLSGLKIAIDCANGSACATASEIFESLGAKVKLLFYKPNGLNINSKCGSLHLEFLIKTVKQSDVDFGIAFDGDADRCLMIDKNGSVVDGDKMLAIFAMHAKENSELEKIQLWELLCQILGFQSSVKNTT